MTGQIREELRTQIKEELRTQLEEENKRSLEIMTNALKEAIKKELSNKGSPELLQIQPDIQQVAARVSTQGSNVVTNVQASQEHHANAIPLMGLYVQLKDGTTRFVEILPYLQLNRSFVFSCSCNCWVWFVFCSWFSFCFICTKKSFVYGSFKVGGHGENNGGGFNHTHSGICR